MRGLLGILALLMMAAPCAAETLRVAVGQKGFWDTSIAAWGDRAGFFKAEGLTLELLYTDGGAETQQAVISGSVEVGIGTGTLGVVGAYLRKAPVRIVSAEWHGASDLFWYAKADSAVRTMKDAAGRTAGFSATGSSSHLVLLGLLDAAGVQAKPVPTGGAGATLTQVMSGQVDLGWSVPPIGLKEVNAGQLRIVARGAELPDVAGQTTRVNIMNATWLAANRETAERFARAYRRSLEWAYTDPRAIEWYAEGLGVDKALAQQVRDEYYRREAMQPDVVRGLDLTLRQAIELKRAPAGTTVEQLRPMVDLLGGPS